MITNSSVYRPCEPSKYYAKYEKKIGRNPKSDHNRIKKEMKENWKRVEKKNWK